MEKEILNPWYSEEEEDYERHNDIGDDRNARRFIVTPEMRKHFIQSMEVSKDYWERNPIQYDENGNAY